MKDQSMKWLKHWNKINFEHDKLLSWISLMTHYLDLQRVQLCRQQSFPSGQVEVVMLKWPRNRCPFPLQLPPVIAPRHNTRRFNFLTFPESASGSPPGIWPTPALLRRGRTASCCPPPYTDNQDNFHFLWSNVQFYSLSHCSEVVTTAEGQKWRSIDSFLRHSLSLHPVVQYSYKNFYQVWQMVKLHGTGINSDLENTNECSSTTKGPYKCFSGMYHSKG